MQKTISGRKTEKQRDEKPTEGYGKKVRITTGKISKKWYFFIPRS
jgi:hypothetical protein